MLKVKDLNILKSYGFYKVGNDWIFGDENESCITVENDKYLGIYYTCSYLDGDVPDFILDMLYTLIKDGIVEKEAEE